MAVHGTKPGWTEKSDREIVKAIKHVEFCCALYKYQIQQGRHLLHEHPWTARSWKLLCVTELLNHPAVKLAQGHMCQFRMVSHVERRGGEMGLAKKPAGLMTSSKCLLELLNKKCDVGRDRTPLIAGRAAGAAIYPGLLCKAICRGVVRQKKHERTSTVSTGRLSHYGLESFVRHICDL